ncbi:sialidase family protein [Paenibacillus koleovorans]|uniref:sialidase family protein n=1 Tax=Paenibacillus koleovorans TaxID=121608 RepID=UPI000FDAC2E0|nr:sialidase family protein [Paenibacillus koleovorans]
MSEPAIQPGAGDFGQPRVIVPAPANLRYAHLSWPKIVKAANGNIVLAFLAGTTHRMNGCPAVAVSTDGGDHFGATHILAELHEGLEFEHSGNLALGIAADGSVVLLAMALRSNQSSSTIMGWRSVDSGVTWASVDTSKLQQTAGSVYGHLFIVPGKGLAATGHFRRGASLREQGLWISLSTDDGLSWGEPRIITERHLAEPAFCFVNDKVIGLAKGMKESGIGYTQFVSTDYAASWEVANPVLSLDPDPASPTIIPDPSNPGIVYAFQSERKRLETDTEPGHITLYRANVSDLLWHKVGIVAYFPKLSSPSAVKRDFGYPWMTKCDNGKWLLVFYDGEFAGPNSIWGLTLDLGDLK